MQRGRNAHRAAVLLIIIGSATSCSREVLVAGSGGGASDGGQTPDAGGAAGQDGGTPQPAPSCTGTLFASTALPGIAMPDVVADAVTGDWNGDGLLDLATVDPNLGAVSVVLGGGGGRFVSRTEYATGSGPVKIAAGDLNGDRRPDLVIANAGASSATVLLGKGDGTFGSRSDLQTGPTPYAVALGDWTSDGKLDVVAGDTLFVGRGDGTFARGVTYGYTPTALAAGDVNQDGRLDLVTTDMASAVVLLGRGDGTFTRKNLLALQGDWPFAMDVRDLNGDARPDLIVNGPCMGRGSPRFYTFLGLGDGSFGPLGEFFSPACGRSFDVTDLNGDGKIDLQFGTSGTWLGNGDGTFQPNLISSLAQGELPVSLADWTGDGALDLAILDRRSVLKVLPGRRDGTFGLPQVPFISPGPDALADVTGDGALDTLSLVYDPDSFANAVALRRGNRDGTFAPRLEWPIGPDTSLSVSASNISFVAAADLNGDGWADIVATPTAGAVTVALGTGAGSFGPRRAYQSGTIAAIGVGELDGNGRPDVLTVLSGNELSISGFTSVDESRIEGSAVTLTGLLGSVAAIADLDGDGLLDVAIVPDPLPVLEIFFGSPGGYYMRKTDFGTDRPVGPLLAADLNHDGNPDLVAMDNQTVRVWLGTGGGAFGTVTEFPIPDAPSGGTPGDYAVRGAAAADVNGDGALDVVVALDRIVVLLGRGDGTFACGESYDPDFVPGRLLAGDLNHDGKADLVASFGDGAAVLLSH